MLNYCSNIDDYRPIQSSLLTRFTTINSSELWRTTNQDYGAFYYRETPQYCIPDDLKAKIHRRYNRFQDWLFYQTKCQSLSPINSNNNQTIFPSNKTETVRITHRKKFLSESNHQLNENTFLPYGEDGLITEFIVKKILKKFQDFINPDEYHDVTECVQVLVSDILNQEPSLCTNEIIARVVTIMLTPPPPQPSQDNCQTISNVFEKLINLENAISKISNPG